MRKTALKQIAALLVAAGSLAWPGIHAQGQLPDFREMEWRNIGPHRASRTKALDGVPSQPHTFYIGVVNGGVWKTTDAGRTWTADLRRAADRIDRRDRGRAVRSRT